MASSASEVFRVVGKIVLEGQDLVEKGLDAAAKKADGLDSSFKKAFSGLGKGVPEKITKPLDDSIDGTSRKMQSFEKDSGGFTNLLKSGFGLGIGMKIFDAGVGVIEKFGGAIKNSVFGMNSTLETTELQFATLMGSAEDAHKQVAFLFEFAKKTPFETEPIIQASKMMQTFGGNALNTEKNLLLIGDAAAATGAPIDELGMWTGRLYASLKAGKPFGDAAARLGELAVLAPDARNEMEKMQKEGKSADEIFTYFQGTLGKFSGAMEKQAGTWQGLTGTFTDTINILSAKAMKPFFELAVKGLAKLDDVLGSDAFGAGAEKIANGIASGIGGAITKVSSIIETVGPTLAKWFGIAKDAVTTFSMALSGNWTDAPGITGIHRAIGNIGLIINDTVIPALGKVKDFLTTAFDTIGPMITSTVVPAFNMLKGVVGPVIDSMIASFGRMLPNIQGAGTQIVDLFTNTIIPAVKNFASAVGPSLVTVADFIYNTALPAYNSLRETVVDVLTNKIIPAVTSFVSTVLPPLMEFAGWFTGTVLNAAVEFGTQLVHIFTEQVVPAVMALVDRVLPGLKAFADWFVTTALPQIKIFADGLIAAWKEIEPEVLGALTTIITMIKDELNGIITFVQANSDTIISIITYVWNHITSILGPLLDGIKNIILLVMNVIQGDWQGAWDNIKKIVTDVLAILLAAITPPLDVIKAIFSGVTDFVGTKFSELGTKLNEIWTTIVTAVTEKVTAVQSVITTIVNAIQAFWNPIWDAIQLVVDTAIRAVATVVAVEMAVTKAVFDTILPPIKALWESIWQGISDFVSTIWNFINNNIITPIFNAIKTFIETSLNAIKTTWDTIWNGVQTTVQTVWNAINTFITGVWNTISTAATTTWNAIKTAVEKPIQDAKNTLDTVWKDISDKATGVWTNIKTALTDGGAAIKNALLWPFEQMRDAVQGLMKTAGNNMLSPLQGAIDGFGDFVGGVKGAINSISSKLGLGDIIAGVWSGAKIRQLAEGTQHWSGGVALIGEKGTEAAQLPNGTIRMFTAPQLVNLPEGTKVWSAADTKRFVTKDPNARVFDGASTGPETYASKLWGKGGWIEDQKAKIGKLGGDALTYARDLVAKGADTVIGGLINKLGIPSFPGAMGGMGQASVTLLKNTAVKGIGALIDSLKANLPAEVATSTDGGVQGAPGTINGISGDKIMDMARITSGVRNYCEKFVGDVFARAGAKYFRATDAFAHSNMQGTTPGTGPTGAPVFTGFATPGDVAISMGNGMVYGTEGNGPLGAGPFRPYSGARYTLNPAANGMVVDRPGMLSVAETIRSQPEIVTPEHLMRSVFAQELQRNGIINAGQPVNIYVTANTDAEGYVAGRAAARGYRDKMLESGFNR